MRRWFVGFAVALTAAAPAQQRFDLECSEAVQTDGDPVAPYVAHYRVDLMAKKWCEDACRVSKPIVRIEPSMLVLEQSSDLEPTYRHTIDRESGEDHIFDQNNGTVMTTGQCRRLPFSGFPASKTKF